MSNRCIGLNRIINPSLSLPDFIQLAVDVKATSIELRNDLKGVSIYDNMEPDSVIQMCKDAQIQIESINALQRFNDTVPRLEEMKMLIDEAKAIGCKAIVLCPINGIAENEDRTRYVQQATNALSLYGPLFKEAGLLGYVEPLGFKQSSLRTKKDAVSAIKQCGFAECYRLTHDTFHHHLAQEEMFFAKQTGLVHLSGVQTAKPIDSMLDCDRVFITKQDQLGNREQIQRLIKEGFAGVFSFEPFAAEVQELSTEELKKALKESMQLLFL